MLYFISLFCNYWFVLLNPFTFFTHPHTPIGQPSKRPLFTIAKIWKQLHLFFHFHLHEISFSIPLLSDCVSFNLKWVLEHLIHLHLKQLLIGMELLQFYYWYFFLFFLHPLSTFFSLLFREEGRKRNTDGREKHQSIATLMHPDWGWNLQPGHVPWWGIKPTTFWLQDDAPTNWATHARALLLKEMSFYFF